MTVFALLSSSSPRTCAAAAFMANNKTQAASLQSYSMTTIGNKNAIEFHHLESMDSTQEEVKRLLATIEDNNYNKLLTVVADEQVKG